MTDDALDLLGLRRTRTGPLVRFGAEDVSFALTEGNLTDALDARSTASVSLLYSLTAGRPVDYLSPLQLGVRDSSAETIRFTGSVMEADREGPFVKLSAETGRELAERQVGFFVGRDCIGPEVVHLMARMAGLPEDRIHVEGLDAMLPIEVVEVLVPVHGVEVAARTQQGNVVLLPGESGRWCADEFDDSEQKSAFQEAPTYALVMGVSRRLLDAELSALGAIDTILAWLTVRARYGLALMPDGTPQSYRRLTARAVPRREDPVLVRGLASGRRWLKASAGSDAPSELKLGAGDVSWRDAPASMTLQDRQALMACARAAGETDVLSAIQGLWEAIEFYVSGVSVSASWDRLESRRIRKAVPRDVNPRLRKRALELLGKLDDPPLMARLAETVRRDGVPLAEGELELLRELRIARNDAVHGRTPVLPQRDQVDHAISIVARLLLYRLGRDRSL